MKINYTHHDHLLSADAFHRAATHDADVEGQMVPVVRLEALEGLLQKWRDQTGAKESISFRLAMKKLEKLVLEKFVDDLRVGRQGDED